MDDNEAIAVIIITGLLLLSPTIIKSFFLLAQFLRPLPMVQFHNLTGADPQVSSTVNPS